MSEPLRSEQFDALLHRLGPDREAAGSRYEQLRRRLVVLFGYRRCPNPEDLADETLDRAARRLEQLGDDFVGSDPACYVYGVAWNVARESFRRISTVPLPDRWERSGAPPDGDEVELRAKCLERCLDRLTPGERKLILGYHEGERSSRIRRRSELAAELEMSPNALRLRIHRLTARLRECVVDCMARSALAGAAG
jgi:DNA-directed RNA polymerase specialized sigma24 family protein